MIWILMVALALAAALALLWPLLGRSRAVARSVEAADYDLRLYRDQLAEVERDAERGTLPADEAARARTEIARRVLDADRARQAAATAQPLPRAALLAGGLAAIAAVVGSFALYAGMGAPEAPDQPIKARLAEADATYAARPDQAKAEAEAAPNLPKVEVPPDFAPLLDKLRATVAAKPDDPEGLQFLAESEARTGNFAAAWKAQAHRIEVLGDQATAEDHAILGELMTRAAGGLITAEAEAHFATALKMDPTNGRARFYAGLILAQNGRMDKAFPVWRALLENGPQDGPWMPVVRQAIGDLAWFAGQPGYQPPGAAGPMMGGPGAADMAAAADMSPEERQAMIRNMVEGLNDRLAKEGGTPEEWGRLISSLGVLGEKDRAAKIWAEAQTRFADAPQALAVVRDGAVAAGLIAGEAPAAEPVTQPGPTAQQMQDAAQMSDADRQAMIEGMVSNLETRLMTEGGPPEEWEKLFNTFTVLNAPDRATKAWAKAQEVFAADAANLDRLRAAAQAAGVTP